MCDLVSIWDQDTGSNPESLSWGSCKWAESPREAGTSSVSRGNHLSSGLLNPVPQNVGPENTFYAEDGKQGNQKAGGQGASREPRRVPADP